MSSPPPAPVSARSLLAGAKELGLALPILKSNREGVPLRAYALLTAHAVELCLKAFLLSRGWSQARAKGLGHDLTSAWKAAAAEGLGIAPAIPYWCELLDSIHSYPYVGRYPPVNSGLVSAGFEELYSNLQEIINLVEPSTK